MNHSERLCLLVLNWNSSADLDKCLASLPPMEYVDRVVVDNGSEINDVSRLEVICGERNALLIKSPANKGYAGGMNIGMRWANEAGYRYALLLNPDTLPTEPLVEEMWRQRREAAVVGVAQTGDMTGADGGERYPTAAIMRGPRSRVFECHGRHRALHYVDIVSGACLLVDLRVAADVDFMDESYFHYREEVDFCVRVRRIGHTIGYTCMEVLRHRRGGSLKKSSPLGTYYHYRNELLFVKKLFGARALWTMRRYAFNFLLENIKRPLAPETMAMRLGLIDACRSIDGPNRHRRLES